MAGFRMHVTTSTVLGCGYVGVGHFYLGLPEETSLVGGALCGFSGMLPDLDSDYGVPLREAMAFTAAIVPMLLVGRFQALLLSYDAMVLAAIFVYLFIRFGIAKLIRRFTVHRGMFHSVPTCLIFVGMAFLICGANSFDIRSYKAGGVAIGFMSHLLLDELYSIEWKGGRWHFKKSFGTALKFIGDDPWANFSTYAKLVFVVMLVLGEPSVMKQLETRYPEFARTVQQSQQRFGDPNAIPSATRTAIESAGAKAEQFFSGGNGPPIGGATPAYGGGPPVYSGSPPTNGNVAPYPQTTYPPPSPYAFPPVAPQHSQPPAYGNGYDTAQRPGSPYE